MSNIKVLSKVIDINKARSANTILSEPDLSDYHIALMPNFSAASNCISGLSASMGKKIVPQLLGNDIGCGIHIAKLGKVDLDTAKLDTIIKKYIPYGRNTHKTSLVKFFPDNELKPDGTRSGSGFERAIGTLGGGSHFIEVDEDSNKNKYLVIHSGSRGYGLKLLVGFKWAEFPSEAQKRKFFYDDLDICMRFSRVNREQIKKIILEKLEIEEESSHDIFHNYIDNKKILRKGSVSARENEKLIIPINEKEGCILGLGKGNQDWNYSAPSSADGIIEHLSPTVEIEKIIKPIYNFKP